MSKPLIYDSKNLTVKQQKWSLSFFLKKALPVVLSALILSSIFIFTFYYFYDSPEEIILKNENAQYAKQIAIFNKKIDNIDKILSSLEYRDNNIYRTLLELDPIPDAIRENGIGGSNRYENLEGYDNSHLIIETVKRLDKISKELYIQSKSYDNIIAQSKQKEDMLKHIPSIQPILNKQLTRIASYFGWRKDPVYKVRKHHDGIDFTAPKGTPIHATGDGIVSLVKKSRRGYGNQIEINHGYGYTSKYAHMARFNVKLGQKVKRGEVIGFVGNTGKSTGPHVHYEVRKNNKPVNPINFFIQDLSPKEYDEMIERSAMAGGQSLD